PRPEIRAGRTGLSRPELAFCTAAFPPQTRLLSRASRPDISSPREWGFATSKRGCNACAKERRRDFRQEQALQAFRQRAVHERPAARLFPPEAVGVAGGAPQREPAA